jgi:antitoxin YefM
MESLSYTALRNNLAEMMDKVCQDHSHIIVTRQNAQSVVMLSLADYTALEETAYLLRSPANAARLAKSIADAEKGRVAERELLE